jgi:hypothetical protein
MENTFLFNDIEEEEVTTETTLPEQAEPTSLFNDLEDEPTYVPPKTTLPSQEGGASSLFDDVETDEDFDMSVDPAVEEPIISTDQPNILSKEDVDTRIDDLFAAGRDKRETEKGTRATVITDEWNTYYERVAQAEKEDEITGGQRALMVPKPQSAQFGLANIKAYETKQEANRDLLKSRLNSKNYITSGLTDRLLNSGLSIDEINLIVFADEIANPVTTLAEIPVHLESIQEHVAKGEYGSAVADVGWLGVDVVTSIPFARAIAGGITKTWKAVGNGGEYNRVQDAMLNESKLGEQIKKQNKEKAKANTEIKNELILNFQDRNNVDISVQNDAGNLSIDPTKVRAAGKAKLKEYYIDDVYQGNNADKSINPLDELAINDEDVLAIPMLNPEKLDALVGVVADLREAFPDLLKTPTVKVAKGKRKGELKRAKPLVDQLFELTVSEDLIANETLYNILNKHGMSYEEYMLGVVGSASQAGRLLNRVSQMSRFKPKGIKERQAEKANQATQKGLSKFWSNTVLRTENIRRGLMVSSLATAARNLQSGVVRAPAEGLGNILDTALITYARAAQEGDRVGGIVGATKNIMPFVRDGTYTGAFRQMKYMFADQNTAEQYTKYILDRPELSQHFDRLSSNIAELQELTGRGQATTRVGQGLDKMASQLEDGVAFLNTPNRWQEMMLRHTTFFSEVERLTNAEWGIDLRKTLDEGRIKDVINDAPELRGANGRSFIDIMDEATTKALDVTYAKQPDFYPFKVISDTITKSGLTVIVPFPRFMFNSMEYMAQNVGGIGIMAARKAMFKDARGVMTPRDRQDITRNLVGIAAITGMYLYRTSDDAGERYESMEFEDQQVDLTGTYPMRQVGWVAEFSKRYNEDTLDTWYGSDMDHIAETWLGTSARTGVGNVMIDEIRDIIVNTEDIVDENRRAKAIGGAVGQYVNTFLTPLFQGVEGQRAAGIKSDVYVDAATEPTLNDDWGTSFGSGFSRSLIQRGLAAPSYEENLPNRVAIDTGDIKRYDPLKKLFLGLNIKEADNDITEYLLEIGFEDPTYELGSRSKIPSEKRAENQYLSAILPLITEVSKDLASDMGDTKSEQHKIARKYVKDLLADAKQEFLTDGYASPYAVAVDDLSRVPYDDRQYAQIMFKKLNDGRNPDPRSLPDLLQLIELSDDAM